MNAKTKVSTFLLIFVVLASILVYLPTFGVYFYADDVDRVFGLA